MKKAFRKLFLTLMPIFFSIFVLGCSGNKPGSDDNSSMVDVDEDNYTELEGDCNDNDSEINPGATEICTDEIDNDCDDYIDMEDSECTDCVDEEICGDGVDNDCDGSIDEDCADCTDDDSDGYGLTGSSGCLYAGYDCVDSDVNIFPGAPELCTDTIDSDCDGDPYNGCDSECVDTDGDGFGSPASSQCTDPRHDCLDTDAEVNPGKTEVLGDGKDNDCDGTIDTPTELEPLDKYFVLKHSVWGYLVVDTVLSTASNPYTNFEHKSFFDAACTQNHLAFAEDTHALLDSLWCLKFGYMKFPYFDGDIYFPNQGMVSKTKYSENLVALKIYYSSSRNDHAYIAESDTAMISHLTNWLHGYYQLVDSDSYTSDTVGFMLPYPAGGCPTGMIPYARLMGHELELVPDAKYYDYAPVPVLDASEPSEEKLFYDEINKLPTIWKHKYERFKSCSGCIEYIGCIWPNQ